jgi:hypothetical protein
LNRSVRRTHLLFLLLLLNVKVQAHPAVHVPQPVARPLPVQAITPTPKPKPARVHKPAPAVTPKPAVAAPLKRWIPSGTGMWTYQWNETERGDARAVLRRARAAGLTHLYVRARDLHRVRPLLQARDIKVIAWDFPVLADPRADARRLAAAARYGVAAVAPDIETPAEGTRTSARAITIYLDELRRLLPKQTPIFGVVPWPSEHRIGRFPYYAVGRKVDALVPMAYWINRDPATVTRETMRRLKPYGKPVMPIGQAYDPRIDVPTLKFGPPSRKQMDAFLHTAQREGAPAASLWVWQFAKPDHWHAVSAFRLGFRVQGRQ